MDEVRAPNPVVPTKVAVPLFLLSVKILSMGYRTEAQSSPFLGRKDSPLYTRPTDVPRESVCPEARSIRYKLPVVVAPYNVSPGLNARALRLPIGNRPTRAASPEAPLIRYTP